MKNNKLNAGKSSAKPMKPWIKGCLIGGAALLVLALVLYLVHYIGLDREFHHNQGYFGEDTYSEIFSLDDSKKQAEPILELAEEAFSFIGTEQEAQERFGLLSRYSCTEANAASESHTLDYIISDLDKEGGYVWVAYVQRSYDAEGEWISGSGTEEERILSRWVVEKQPEGWTVTEIKEHP